jgi:hypothetical protein
MPTKKRKKTKSTGSAVRKRTKSAGLSIRDMGAALVRIEQQTNQIHSIVQELARIRFLPNGVALTNAVQRILAKVDPG